MKKKSMKMTGQGFGPFVLSAKEKEKLDLAMGMMEYADKSPFPKEAVFNSFRRVLFGELADLVSDPARLSAAFQKILKDETAKLGAAEGRA